MASTEEQDLPLILIHRPPEFNVSTDWFHARFRVIDPLDPSFSSSPEAQAQAQSVRALVSFPATPVAAETFDRYPSVELVVGCSTGINHIDLAECRRRGIRATNAGDAFSEDVADYAVGLLLDVLRRISASDRFVRAGLWPARGEYPLGYKLGRKRVGIVGLGSIGSLVAKRLEAFGCTIAYNSRKNKPEYSYPFYENVRDLAADSDALIICCALTDETWHIINKDVLAALGKGGVVVNVGRGALVDEKELVSSLVRGDIGGAGLDVFEDEPNVPRELFDLDNVVMSPHRAVLTPESVAAVLRVAVENLMAFFADKPLVSEVKLGAD